MEFHKTSLLILILCLCFTGCGDSVSSQIKKSTEPNIRKVAVMYMVYSSANNFEGPKDAAELKSWIEGDQTRIDRLKRFGINVEDFDSYMTSNRTGDEFEIRWGVKSFPMAPPYPVAFEPNALDGVRQVGMCGGVTKDVTDDDEYDALWKGEVEPGDEPEEGDRGA